MAKVFYDATTNKEVYDVSGNCNKADCVVKHGLSSEVNTQEVTITGDLAHEVVDGVLQTFDAVARANTDASDKETERQASEDAFKTSLGWTDQQYDDFKASL